MLGKIATFLAAAALLAWPQLTQAQQPAPAPPAPPEAGAPAAPAPAEKLPTAEEIIEKYTQAVGGRDKLKAVLTKRMTGKMTMGPGM